MATILCVEDEDDLREFIAEYMEKAGHQALQAGDGKLALEMILEHRPDLAVCDITMPVMDGHALLVELRKNHSEFANMPFIFLSALADREDVPEGIKIGADDYLIKPIDFEMLAHKVESSLRQVIRMEVLKEKEFIERFKALTGDAGAEPAPTAAAEAEPEAVELDATATDSTTQPSARSESQPNVFGAIFLFDNVNAYEDQLGSHREGIVDWLEKNSHNFLNKALPIGASVTKLPNGGALVCYHGEDRDEASKLSKLLAKKLEEHLRNDLGGELNDFAQKTSISREVLEHLVAVTEVPYETKIGREELNDTKRISMAIQEQIANIYTDESAPMRLISSIRRSNGHLVPLSLRTQSRGALPILFLISN